MSLHFPKDKDEAIRRLRDEAYQVRPGQVFQVARMEPGDAWGVARCFYQVYGEHYPFDTYYVPEKLIEANRAGDMIGVVARTGAGDIIGYGSLFRNFAHNPRLYETGQATVIPEYRATLAVLCIQNYIFDAIAEDVEIDAIFGEPVCNHLVMQKISAISGFSDTGIELGLMPGKTYHGEESPDCGRVSTVLSFRVLRDNPCRLHLPLEYEQVLRSVISGLPISREIGISSAPVPDDAVSDMVVRYFDHSRVVRLSLPALGADFGELLAAEEERALARGIEVFQVFLNLAEPWCGRAVSCLRERGFFFGGFLPLWFGTDGLLMQKPHTLPDFESVNLLSEESRGLLEFIKNDIGNRI